MQGVITMKQILTNQFLGATFTNMVKRNIYHIEISKLNQIEKTIDQSLRTTHNAMLLFSDNDILSTVDEYSDFFSINQNIIIIKKELSKKNISDSNEHLISMLQKYFTASIPISIFDTLTSILDKEL